MDIGIGIPNVIPGTEGRTIVEWARRAEARGFAGLATIDRIAYPSYDSIATLAAAAAVTERIRLVTNVLLGPTRNPVLLAKEAASLDQISGGRFVLGVGVGSREDDYTASEHDFHRRGRRWDQDLEVIHAAWRGEPVRGAQKPVGPPPTNGDRVPMLFGGMTDAAIERTVKWGIGWTVGGAAADQAAPFAERVRQAWKDAGKPGRPRIVGLTYFGLRQDALERATEYLGDYYGDMGVRFAQSIPKSPEALRDTVKAFEGAGFDELFLDPTVDDLDEIDRAAEAVLG
jgi:alkanesulfonate monooxygenase SsuD/methylene tetrahydromethanopterin reductase-like flavin-dependent oxidoreductase (luciferase family)